MLSINMDDVMQVVSNIQNYLIAFGVVLVLALLVMFAVRKMPKAKKKMIRAQSGLAILLALVDRCQPHLHRPHVHHAGPGVRRRFHQ